MDGTLETTAEGCVIRFERHLRHSVDTVWAALTQSDKLGSWLASADIDLVEGGKIELRFGLSAGNVMLGRIVRVDAPYLLEYTWSSLDAQDTLVRWALVPAQDGCLLELTHLSERADELPVMMAGWHVHLDMLAQVLIGSAVSFPWSRWETLRAHYVCLCEQGSRQDAAGYPTET